MVSSGVALTAQFPDNKTIPIIPSFDVSKNWNVAAATVRYSTTKLLELVILQKLSEIVSPDDVIITAVDPGFTGGSGLHRNLAAPARAIFGLIKIFTARSPKEAAWIYLDAAAVRGKESHGGFIVNWDIYPLHPAMYTPEGKQTSDRLWDETMKELEFAGAPDILRSISRP
ncbi:putative short-chain dehydrogenase reductase family protein [Phaeoacremonium minimum UCRPA7]|uniref:Putative short-chain dehydrogenase reductase family protein n=1 Tax=Phaeoacremonium minimum (strain UCR-PA7) TaxID=1286976 RepID=R8BHA3_PHAM7|nr:putative short-chain dehydrogenase reductase family protein [Phaeoacremonium minimum UCRPA7]EON98681.1 putative short-chain dehydrogenase reductase family protein [Phaeoacremonium minimum UCRPA7]